jgi:hypothetical protein
MKRSTPNLRQPSERKTDTQGQYGVYLRDKSKINPIFTAKPYLGGKRENERGLQEKVN